jgi:CheY-like chemotaxis protein
VPECRQHIVERSAPARIGHGSSQHERKVAQVRLGCLEKLEPGDAHDCGHRVIAAGHHEVSALLSFCDQSGYASLGGLGDTQLMSVSHDRHTVTIQISVQISARGSDVRPQQDSNLRTRLRRPMLYPLSYGGCATWERLPAASPSRTLRSEPHGRAGRRQGRRVGREQGREEATLTHVTQNLGRRVLVVDDDEVIRRLIAVNLQLEGFEVSMAVDGQDCLDKVVEVAPDVITLDVMMPRLDGWETAVRLRQSPETAHIKVVLISARAQEDDKARGSRVGADAYLTKPFDPNEMIRIVRDLAGPQGTQEPQGSS